MKARKEIPDEEVRKIELDIFSHIVTICEKYELRYIIMEHCSVRYVMAVSFRGTMISIFRCRVRIMRHLSGYFRMK